MVLEQILNEGMSALRRKQESENVIKQTIIEISKLPDNEFQAILQKELHLSRLETEEENALGMSYIWLCIDAKANNWNVLLGMWLTVFYSWLSLKRSAGKGWQQDELIKGIQEATHHVIEAERKQPEEKKL